MHCVELVYAYDIKFECRHDGVGHALNENDVGI
jgi:hypothetical protein